MGIINRYVLRLIAVPTLLALVAVAFVGIAGDIQWRIRDLPVAQLMLVDVLRLGLYLLPAIVSYVVPATYLMGILLAFGRLSQDGEIVAMKAAGIPLKRVVIPVIVLGALLSGLCLVVQDRIQPWAIGKAYKLLFADLPLRVTLDVLPTGVMQDFAGWRVYIGNRDSRTGALQDIVILQPQEGRRATAYYADSAVLAKENGQSILEMRNVDIVPVGEDGRMTRMRTASAQLVVPKVEDRMPKTSRGDLTLAGLFANEREFRERMAEDRSEPSRLELQKLRREISDRLSLPFACLAVTLVAAPLGARSKRSGKSYAFAVGFSVILTYYVLQLLMAPRQLCPLEIGVLRAWAPNLILCIAGMGFLWEVDRV